ncbi:ABC transporter substrate-binding protein [Rhizobium binxianense]
MRKLSQFVRLGLLSAAMVLPAVVVSAEEITWWAPNWGEARAKKLAEDFHAANPDVTVKLEITVANGLQNRIEVALRSGTPPDLIDTSMQWVVPFASSGKLLDLDQFAKQQVKLDDLLPATLDSTRYNGHIYGLPYRAQTLALIYNKALYRDAGLDPENPPKTWSEFIKASQALTKTNAAGKEQYGIGVAGGGEMGNLITRLVPFMWMNGGDVLNADFTKATVNEKAAVEAVEFYTSPLTKYKIAPPSTLQNDGLALRRLFDAGTVAQYFSGQYDLPAIQQEAPNLEIGVGPFPHPEGKQTSGILSGWAFVVPSDSKHKDAALRFAKFLMLPENQGYYTDTFPASISAMNLPRFKDPLLQPFKEMLKFTKPVPSTPAWIKTQQILFSHTQEVMLGSATPQEAMDAAADDINDALAR